MKSSWLLVLSSVCLVQVAPARDLISLNHDWTFKLGNASTATAVTLPHTWNSSDSADKQRPYRRDVGVYRRPLSVDGDAAAYYLYFEGANQIATLRLDGNEVASHVGGYSAFAVDVTDLIGADGKADLEMTVDNRHKRQVPPLNADFTFYGGIYRDAWLISTGAVHFDIDETATTRLLVEPDIDSPDGARVNISGNLRNRLATSREVRVRCDLLDGAGATVANASGMFTVGANGTQDFVLPPVSVDSPHLWSPDTPYLYAAECRVVHGTDVLDQVRRPLGFRWFRADPQKGFFLNGKPYRLYGTNRHQDFAGMGNALPNGIHRADVAKIKADGFNFLRLAHYPQDPSVLRAADELGLIVWEEIPLVNVIDMSDEFSRVSVQMAREMVRQHRHHPSIVFWGSMNEIMLRRPEDPPPGYDARVVSLARELDGVLREEDDSRLTAMALSRDELEYMDTLGKVPDVLGLNIYFGWYYETFDALGSFLDDLHERYPQRPLLISEYGAGSDSRVHATDPQAFDFSVEHQQRFHEHNFRQIRARPWLIGSAVWNHFDFGSNHREDTRYAVNQKGLWTFDRVPKDVAWLYRAELLSEPVLHLTTREWQRRAGSRSADRTTTITAYSNQARVELSLNGVSHGVQTPNGSVASWQVALQPGVNRLVARADDLADTDVVNYEDRGVLFDRSDGDRGRLPVLAVNVGGREQIVDPDGLVYEADRAYSRNSWGYLGGEAARHHRRIFNTDLDPLLQSVRGEHVAYRFDVRDGRYAITLAAARQDANDGVAERFRVNGVEAVIHPRRPYESGSVTAVVTASANSGIRIVGEPGAALAALVIQPHQDGDDAP